jgi:hypothetical protein
MRIDVAPRGSANAGQRRSQSLALIIGRILDEQSAGEAFELFAQLVDTLGLLEADACHEWPAMWLDGDHAFGLKLAHGLAHKRAAYAGQFTELPLG